MAAESEGMTYEKPEPLTMDSVEEDENASAFSLDVLSTDSEVYKKIKIDLKASGLFVQKIERLSNVSLKKRYINERDLMFEQRHSQDPNFEVNEKFLYHGTSAKKESICEEGLDSRVAKQGCFGKGIYFSDYPKKCVKYAEKGGNTESIILLMRVILGDVKVYPKGEKDKTLLREPEKPQPCTGFRYYDSVEGCPVNHREFVVYESRRALVECIVTYKKAADKSVDAQSELAENNRTENDPYSEDEEDVPFVEDSDTTTSDEDDLHEDAHLDCEEEEVEGLEESEDQKDPVLTQLEKDFFQKTGVNDKHLADVYLLMADMDLDKAIGMHGELTKQDGTGDAEQGLYDKLEEMYDTKNKKAVEHIDKDRWKAMSAADREATTKCLVDNFLEVISKDKGNEADKQLARKYLEAVDMDLDLAIIAYYEEMASDP